MDMLCSSNICYYRCWKQHSIYLL